MPHSLAFGFGHGDNSENLEISEFFGRKIPNAVLPFPCSFHHDNLKFSQNFENLSINKKILSSQLLHINDNNDNSEFF